MMLCSEHVGVEAVIQVGAYCYCRECAERLVRTVMATSHDKAQQWQDERVRAESLEETARNLAKLSGKKQRMIARGRTIIKAAMMMEAGWEDRAEAWLDETGPEGGDA